MVFHMLARHCAELCESTVHYCTFASHVGAEVSIASLAGITPATQNIRIDTNPFTGLKINHP